MSEENQKRAVAALSVTSNSILVAAKLVIGLLIGSVSVISEAIHSGIDLVAAGITLFSVSRSSKPSDDQHPFGHGKLENLSGTAEALLIFVAAIWIIYESMERLLHPKPLETIGWGVMVMFISSAINLVVSNMLFKVGKRTHSMALMADGWHLRTDVWTAAGVMVGLGLIWIGETIFGFTSLHWLDPVAAIVVALLIIHTAYKLTVESARDLLDARLPEEELVVVKSILEPFTHQSCGYHDLRTRRSGPTRFIEFHLWVDPLMSVRQSHQLTDDITESIWQEFPGTDVTIHTEPCEVSHLHGNPTS
jgi:cation diffusion facilitator family transporter